MCPDIAQHGHCVQRNLSCLIGRTRLHESGQSGQIVIIQHRVSGHPFKSKTKAKIKRKKTTQSMGTAMIVINSIFQIFFSIFQDGGSEMGDDKRNTPSR